MQEINENSRFSEFIKNVETRISKLTTLEVKTIIGDFEVDTDANVKVDAEQESQVIASKINLIEGDVTTYISNELVQDKFGWIREFHAEKELKGHEIVKGNINAIISLFDLYKKTKKVKLDEENIDETEFEDLETIESPEDF